MTDLMYDLFVSCFGKALAGFQVYLYAVRGCGILSTIE